MKNLLVLSFILFLSACTASTFYSSPNNHQYKELGIVDTVHIFTKSSAIIVETKVGAKNTIFWRYDKNAKKRYSVSITEIAKTVFISDTLSTTKSNEITELHLELEPNVVVAVFNEHGKTLIHHSGVAAVYSTTGNIEYFLARNHFKAESISGTISIKLSEVFDHSGFVRSESGLIKMIIGEIASRLTIDRKIVTEKRLIKRNRPVDLTPLKPPYLHIESLQDNLVLESAGSILW